jgi:hypothetical protein
MLVRHGRLDLPELREEAYIHQLLFISPATPGKWEPRTSTLASSVTA